MSLKASFELSRRWLSNCVKHVLANYGIKPKRKLGQNFTVEPSLILDIVSRADIKPNEQVIEVGAGIGFLTRLLAKRAGKVLAVEIDPKLVKVLRWMLEGFNNVEIVEGDFLKLTHLKTDKLVSTVPYSISSAFIFKLLKNVEFKKALLILQKEFAERLIAKPGSKDYGRLTVSTAHYANVKLLRYVSRRCFFPAPEVDSAMVEVELKDKPYFKVNEERFMNLIRMLFSQRNRLTPTVLRRFFPNFDRARLPPFLTLRRVKELSLNDIYEIYKLIYGNEMDRI